MPFKSKAQQRFMFAAEDRGEVPEGTAEEWAEHTPNIKALPEHKKKASEIAAAVIEKVAASNERESHPIRGAVSGLAGGIGGGLLGGVGAGSLPVSDKAQFKEMIHPNKTVGHMMNDPQFPHLKNMNAKQRVQFRRTGIGGAVGGLAGLIGGAMLGS